MLLLSKTTAVVVRDVSQQISIGHKRQLGIRSDRQSQIECKRFNSFMERVAQYTRLYVALTVSKTIRLTKSSY